MALTFENDENHVKAVKISKDIFDSNYGQTCISDYIFDETVTFIFGRTRSLQKATNIGETIKSSAKMLMVGESEFNLAWEAFKKQKEMRLSFTDWTNVAMMGENGIDSIATFDREFKRIKSINVID
ncbi:MAG: type II toxin-antitoxin system VapC family toxin [Candidatus Micrarchaeota archaeon]|nr:type II toxin-antitoxin system VapC family toxin [Candidatus Micrarchaeota archaeon]